MPRFGHAAFESVGDIIISMICCRNQLISRGIKHRIPYKLSDKHRNSDPRVGDDASSRPYDDRYIKPVLEATGKLEWLSAVCMEKIPKHPGICFSFRTR